MHHWTVPSICSIDIHFRQQLFPGPHYKTKKAITANLRKLSCNSCFFQRVCGYLITGFHQCEWLHASRGSNNTASRIYCINSRTKCQPHQYPAGDIFGLTEQHTIICKYRRHLFSKSIQCGKLLCNISACKCDRSECTTCGNKLTNQPKHFLMS